ncbi:MAG: hypothetical protein CMD67_04225 [Gammaproteobacteria bacterium]|jgi:uncharacterized protein|nr:hypothetical protein [Gammaproteobacteria bacterium]|tara:strand:+ start:235 stop:612 length:378 start_codon:yes stop_codon:yes gene_type:complete
MKLSPLLSKDKQVIKAYDSSGFDVNGKHYNASIFVTSNQTEIWNVEGDPQKLKYSDFEEYISNKNLDVLLVGTGIKFVMIPQQLRQSMRNVGIGVECMDTAAGCRTYNILLSEGRSVAAALMIAG